MTKLEPSEIIKRIIERHADEIANEILRSGLRSKNGLEPEFELGLSPFEIKTSRSLEISETAEPLGFTLLIRFIPDSSGIDLLEGVSLENGDTKH